MFPNLKLSILVLTTSSIVITLLIESVNCCNSKNRHGISNSTPCRSDGDCRPKDTFLACVKGRCTCSTVSAFNSDVESCLLYIGGSCTLPKFKGQGYGQGHPDSCVPNAFCQSTNPLAIKGSCECQDGFEETEGGFCVSKNRTPSQSNRSTQTSWILLITSGILIRASVGIPIVMMMSGLLSNFCIAS